MLRDDFLCRYCEEAAASVISHIVPFTAGGSNRSENLVASCAPCNYAAGDWLFGSFEIQREYVRLRRFGSRIEFEAFREVNATRGWRPAAVGESRFEQSPTLAGPAASPVL